MATTRNSGTLVDVSKLPRGLRKKVLEATPELEQAYKNELEAEKLESKMGTAGRNMYKALQKVRDQYISFVKECEQIRDETNRLRGLQYDLPLGKSFIHKDKMFKTAFEVRSVNRLDEGKASKAKALVDDYIAEIREESNLPDSTRTFLDFLMNIFTQQKKRFTYTDAVHAFLSMDFDHLKLIQAQDMLIEAIEVSEPYSAVRFYAKEDPKSKWVQLPIEWRTPANVATAVIQKRREKKREAASQN